MSKFTKQVREIYKPLQLPMLGVLGFIAASQALNLMPSYFNSKVIDALTLGKPLQEALGYALIGLTAMLTRNNVVRWWRERYELKHIDFAIPRRTQEVTLQRMFGFSISQHASENSGIKQSIATRGENALRQLAEQILFQVLPLSLEILILTGALLYWSPVIGSIVGVSILLHVASVGILNNRFRKDFKNIEKAYIQDGKFKSEVIENIGIVIAHGQEKRMLGECDKSLNDVNTLAQGVWSRFVTFATMRDNIPIIGRYAVLLVSIYGVVNKQYTIGELTLFVSWTANALGNLGELSPLHRQLIKAITSVRRYFDMLNIPPEITEVSNPIQPAKFRGEIEFRDVTFRYTRRDTPGYLDKDEETTEKKTEPETPVSPALDSVSLKINAGETVAFVGESGAGKSTIIHALIRAKDPEKGQILVDGNDLRLLDLTHYRHSIGIVDQTVSLFDQSLRENILFGLNGTRAQIGDHELREVATMACIDRFWSRLEKGFDTIIGERGVKLSGGERQRVGIARALVKNPDILIFDEATSNLDSENEALIQESIERAAAGRTTIIIAHRFSTIRNVDRVFVFDKGQLVGEGSHAELALSCEAYQRLTKNQFI